jgi:NTE family protein
MKITTFMQSFFSHTGNNKGDDFPGLFDLMMRSMDVMQTTIARFKLAAYTPDLVVNIPRDKCGFFEFYRAGELIEFGYGKTEQSLKVLEQGNS